MLCVAGLPMVVLAAKRAGNAGAAVVVATSDTSDDDLIDAAARHAGIMTVRGSLHDPLARFARAAASLEDKDTVVRLTADNVFPDGALIALLTEALAHEGLEYARIGGIDSGLPYGVSAEAFTVSALRQAHEGATSAHDREHVTPWIREVFGDRSVRTESRVSWPRLRCTVDTFGDYLAVARVFEAYYGDPIAVTWQDLSDALALAPASDRGDPS